MKLDLNVCNTRSRAVSIQNNYRLRLHWEVGMHFYSQCILVCTSVNLYKVTRNTDGSFAIKT